MWRILNVPIGPIAVWIPEHFRYNDIVPALDTGWDRVEIWSKYLGAK